MFNKPASGLYVRKLRSRRIEQFHQESENHYYDEKAKSQSQTEETEAPEQTLVLFLEPSMVTEERTNPVNSMSTLNNGSSTFNLPEVVFLVMCNPSVNEL
jgi:hypothetical protein